MPKNSYSKQNTKNRAIRSINKPKFLTKPLRKCPSCRQDAVIETKILPEKVILHCKNCYLRYVLTRFPAFEEIDYYNKMLDIYRKENWTRRLPKGNITEKDEEETPEKLKKQTSTCPICRIGNLEISNYFIHGSQIIKCNNNDCDSKFKAPQKAFFRISEDFCSSCGWPVLISMESLPKLVCFNPECTFHNVCKIKWRN